MDRVTVALLDDHPAVRAGIEAILEREPGIVAVGAAATEQELWPLLRTARPDVVVLDLHHPGRDGLVLALRIKRAPGAPRVVLYSAAGNGDLLVPATLARADGIVDKSSSPDELVRVIRGERPLPPVSPRQQRRAAAELEPRDRPILAMRLAGTPPDEIATTLRLSGRETDRRIAAVIARLAGDHAREAGERETRAARPRDRRLVRFGRLMWTFVEQ